VIRSSIRRVRKSRIMSIREGRGRCWIRVSLCRRSMSSRRRRGFRSRELFSNIGSMEEMALMIKSSSK